MLRKKLDDKSKKMVLVGYQAESSNYRLYDPVTKRVSMSRVVVFDEELSGVSKQAGSRDEGVLFLPKTRMDDEVIEIEDDDELVIEDPGPIQRISRPEDKAVEQVPTEQRHKLRDRARLRIPRRY